MNKLVLGALCCDQCVRKLYRQGRFVVLVFCNVFGRPTQTIGPFQCPPIKIYAVLVTLFAILSGFLFAGFLQ